MTDAPDDSTSAADEQPLLAALGRALPRDPVPEGLVDRAVQLVAFHDVDRELAALLEHPSELVGMRGDAQAGTTLAFGTPQGTLALEVSQEQQGLQGQLLAGAVTEVDLESRSGVVATAPVDTLGRFTFDAVPAGPTRLRLHSTAHDTPAAASPEVVVTDWFLS